MKEKESQGQEIITMSKVSSIDEVKKLLIRSIDNGYKIQKDAIDKIIEEDDLYLLAKIHLVNEAGQEELTN